MESEDINPYAPPLSNVGKIEGADLHDAPSAGSGKRFLNYLIDRVAVFGIFFVLGIVLVTLDEYGVTFEASSIFDDMSFLQDMLLTGVVTVMYYCCFEGACGRSLGKWITGTKVVSVTGEPLSFGKVLGRNLTRLVPFEAFSFLGDADSGWHDAWSGTRVIDLRAVPVSKPRAMSASSMPRFYKTQSPVPPAD